MCKQKIENGGYVFVLNYFLYNSVPCQQRFVLFNDFTYCRKPDKQKHFKKVVVRSRQQHGRTDELSSQRAGWWAGGFGVNYPCVTPTLGGRVAPNNIYIYTYIYIYIYIDINVYILAISYFRILMNFNIFLVVGTLGGVPPPKPPCFFPEAAAPRPRNLLSPSMNDFRTLKLYYLKE